MIMLHGVRGLGADLLVSTVKTASTTTSSTPTPGTCSSDGLKIWDAGGFWRRLKVGESCAKIGTTVIPTRIATTAPTTSTTPPSSGCPSGYVQSEFGCLAPTTPNAPCPTGSIQTGYGCLPSTPAPAPTTPPPTPTKTAPTPPPPTVMPTEALTLAARLAAATPEQRLTICSIPQNSTQAACTRLFAELEAKTGYIPTKTAPGTQVTPVQPVEASPPVAPTTPKVSKGAVILGVLGAGAALAAIVLGTRH